MHSALEEQKAIKNSAKDNKKRQKDDAEDITNAVMVVAKDSDDEDSNIELPSKKSRRKKDVWDGEDRNRAAKSSIADKRTEDIEGAIIELAFGSKKDFAVETEPKMNAYANDKSIDQIFEEGNLKGKDDEMVREALENLGGAEMLISIYCTRELNFSSVHFKTEMRRLGVPEAYVHKLYKLMETWRRLAAVSVPSSATSISSMSSVSSSTPAVADDASSTQLDFENSLVATPVHK